MIKPDRKPDYFHIETRTSAWFDEMIDHESKTTFKIRYNEEKKVMEYLNHNDGKWDIHSSSYSDGLLDAYLNWFAEMALLGIVEKVEC